MEIIKNFNDLIQHLSHDCERKRVAVVCASDKSTQSAVAEALKEGFVDAIFVGCKESIEATGLFNQYSEHVSYIDAENNDDAAKKAVALVREGKADILMKGLISTDSLLHAVLNKETGILPHGRVLTHITAALIPTYNKFLLFTDPAVLPYPNQEQRIEQIKYTVNLCHSIGIEEPKISLIHCSEKVGEKFFPFTVGYKEIIEKANNNLFGKCIVDGPLDVKTSCCYESMKTKGINSPINGEADALIFPDIEAGNVFYKTITLFCGAETAGALQGTIAPVVLPSRSDSFKCKFNSLALAAISCH